VLGILIIFNQKQGVYKWACGYLGVPLAPNVASTEILLDTDVLDTRCQQINDSMNNVNNRIDLLSIKSFYENKSLHFIPRKFISKTFLVC